MNTQIEAATVSARFGICTYVQKVIGALKVIPSSAISLIARIGIAGLFWRSGQTKVDGWHITDSTLYLFEEEYALPIIPPELAANLAVFAEHFFPVLIIAGIATRLSAAALLGMAIVIQLFVYPGSWPDHFTWAAALLFLVARGGGVLSIDHLVDRYFSRQNR